MQTSWKQNRTYFWELSNKHPFPAEVQLDPRKVLLHLGWCTGNTQPRAAEYQSYFVSSKNHHLESSLQTEPWPSSDWPLFLALLEAQFPAPVPIIPLLVLRVGFPAALPWALPNTNPPLMMMLSPSKLGSWSCHQTGTLAFGHLSCLAVRCSQNKSDNVPRVSCPTGQTPKSVYQREQQASKVPFPFWLSTDTKQGD